MEGFVHIGSVSVIYVLRVRVHVSPGDMLIGQGTVLACFQPRLTNWLGN